MLSTKSLWCLKRDFVHHKRICHQQSIDHCTNLTTANNMKKGVGYCGVAQWTPVDQDSGEPTKFPSYPRCSSTKKKREGKCIVLHQFLPGYQFRDACQSPNGACIPETLAPLNCWPWIIWCWPRHWFSWENWRETLPQSLQHFFPQQSMVEEGRIRSANLPMIRRYILLTLVIISGSWGSSPGEYMSSSGCWLSLGMSQLFDSKLCLSVAKDWMMPRHPGSKATCLTLA